MRVFAFCQVGVFVLDYKGMQSLWSTCLDGVGELACAQTAANADLRLAQALAGTNAKVLQYWPETLLTQVGLQTIEQWSAAWSRLESSEEEEGREGGRCNGRRLGGWAKGAGEGAQISKLGKPPREIDRIMCLGRHWMDLILANEKTIELRS